MASAIRLTKQQKNVIITLATTGRARSRRVGLILGRLEGMGLVYTVWPPDGEEGFGRPALTQEGAAIAQSLIAATGPAILLDMLECRS